MSCQLFQDGQRADAAAAQGASRHALRLTDTRLRGPFIARLIVISGPSGAGKGTLIERLLEAIPEVAVSVSATTRPRRRGESDGREYFFLSEREFVRRVDEGWFLEWAAYAGHLYGTPRPAVQEHLAAGRDVILEIELEGARQIRERCSRALMIFIMPPSVTELERRLRGRKTDSEAAIGRRLARAKEEIDEVQARLKLGRGQFDYVIVNDSVNRASEELVRLVQRTREEHEQADSR